MDERTEQTLRAMFGQITPSSSLPQYKCEACMDSGWVEITDDLGVKRMKKCACRLAREAEERMAASGLADAVRRQTLENFTVSTRAQETLYTTAVEYLNRLLNATRGDRHPWMFIGGNPGSGKTHICTAICGELLNHNIAVKYMQWVDEARTMKASVNDDDFDELISGYTNVSVLYIDDLLKQQYRPNPVFTEADIKVAFSILNARYLMNKPTIISSEWDLFDHLLPADEGVFSRVYERCKGFTVSIERKPENNYRMRRETA